MALDTGQYVEGSGFAHEAIFFDPTEPKASIRFSYPETIVYKDEEMLRVWTETIEHSVAFDASAHAAMVQAQHQAIASGCERVTAERLLLALMTSPRCQNDPAIRGWRETEGLLEGLELATMGERQVFTSIFKPERLPYEPRIDGVYRDMARCEGRNGKPYTASELLECILLEDS